MKTIDELRDCMIFMCQSLINMLSNSTWTVCCADKENGLAIDQYPDAEILPEFCSYCITSFGNFQKDFYITPIIRNGQYAVFCRGEKSDGLCICNPFSHDTQIAIHEYFKTEL